MISIIFARDGFRYPIIAMSDFIALRDNDLNVVTKVGEHVETFSTAGGLVKFHCSYYSVDRYKMKDQENPIVYFKHMGFSHEEAQLMAVTRKPPKVRVHVESGLRCLVVDLIEFVN